MFHAVIITDGWQYCQEIDFCCLDVLETPVDEPDMGILSLPKLHQLSPAAIRRIQERRCRFRSRGLLGTDDAAAVDVGLERG